MQVHSLYNPEGITQYNVVPGLMGVILTMTLVMMTGLAITRERERGTMENLLATPVLPIEVMTGKIVPYVIIGLVQATIILAASSLCLSMCRSSAARVAIYLAALLFIAANLTVGITLSSLAQNQLQADAADLFLLPAELLLSGFMFPFRRACRAGRNSSAIVLPLTYFNRLSARHPAQGQWLDRPVAVGLADGAVHGRRVGHRIALLPAHARLGESG